MAACVLWARLIEFGVIRGVSRVFLAFCVCLVSSCRFEPDPFDPLVLILRSVKYTRARMKHRNTRCVSSATTHSRQDGDSSKLPDSKLQSFQENLAENSKSKNRKLQEAIEIAQRIIRKETTVEGKKFFYLEEGSKVSRRNESQTRGNNTSEDYETSEEASHTNDRGVSGKNRAGDSRQGKRGAQLGKRAKNPRYESSDHEESAGVTRVSKLGSSVLPRAMKGKRINLIENELDNIAEHLLEDIEAAQKEAGIKPSSDRRQSKTSPKKPYELDEDTLERVRQQLASVVSDIALLKECQMVNVYNSLIGKKLVKIRHLLEGIEVSEESQEAAEEILASIDTLFTEAIKTCSRLLVSSVIILLTKFFDEKDIVKEFHLNEEKMPVIAKLQSFSRSESTSGPLKPPTPERAPPYSNGTQSHHVAHLSGASKPMIVPPPPSSGIHLAKQLSQTDELNLSKAEARASRRENRLHLHRRLQDDNESSSNQNLQQKGSSPSPVVVSKGKGTTRSGRAISGEPQEDTPPPTVAARPSKVGRPTGSKSPPPAGTSNLVAKIARGQTCSE